MKTVLVLALLVCVVAPSQATYYEITTDIYTPGLSLQTGDSLYMTDGGFGDLNLLGEDVIATIEGTSSLVEGSGGIWYLNCSLNSHLDLSGGGIHRLTMNNDATTVLTGGLIEAIYSYQDVWTYDNSDPPVLVPNPHITLYYSGDLPAVQEIGGFDYLVGAWGDWTTFSIYLHDTGYDAYGNFEFILVPEPATLVLLGLGGLLLRRKK